MFSITVKLRSVIPTVSSLLVGEIDPAISMHADGHPVNDVSFFLCCNFILIIIMYKNKNLSVCLFVILYKSTV